jgi:hypothetical protein
MIGASAALDHRTLACTLRSTNTVESMISIARGYTHNVKLLNVWVFIALGRPWHCFGSHTFD